MKSKSTNLFDADGGAKAPEITDVYAGSPEDQVEADKIKLALNKGQQPKGAEEP